MNHKERTKKDIYTSFNEYHLKNPQVYDLIKNQALLAIAKGRNKISFKAIVKYVRWEMYVKVDKTDSFKINDAYHSRYSRLFTNEFPQHFDKVEQRKLRS